MGSDDKKADAKGKRIKGKVKEKAGHAVGDDNVEAEGRSEQAGADAREAAEKAKDVFRR